jgi:sigma-B regulation protein RsbQ
MGILERHHVTAVGLDDAQPMVFAHGFGCDQTMWRHVAPAFADRYRVITFDHVGAGGPAADYDEQKYSTLQGYAADVLEIVRALDLREVVLVGHSVSAMIGALAVIEEPDRFDKLVLVAPSPRYIDDDSYTGGFSGEDVEELLDSLASNYLGWSSAMAPVIVGNADRPQLGSELTASFCRMDPEIARQFARATFFSDNREDLAKISVPTLVLQCSDDVLAPDSVGEYVAKAVPDATLVHLAATGHCPNLSAPEETVAAIDHFLRRLQVV